MPIQEQQHPMAAALHILLLSSASFVQKTKPKHRITSGLFQPWLVFGVQPIPASRLTLCSALGRAR
jgi:hypothetical protein